jgi:methylated-DNA-[protein]-cysteine S-methyltransferase
MIVPPPERLILSRVGSPLGDLLLATDERELLRGLWFESEQPSLPARPPSRLDAVATVVGAAPAAIRRALKAYFAGDLARLRDIQWATDGTPFQQRVWTALTAIPAGTTTTYGALAAGIGRPRAVRAVGAANGANPIAIVVPCHRLVGADGTLTGYGGGLERKRWLLAHEGVDLPEFAATK